MTAPGLAEASAINRMRLSWLSRGSRGLRTAMSRTNDELPMTNGQCIELPPLRHSAFAVRDVPRSPLQAVALQAAVESGPAQAERFRGLRDVAVVAGHGLLDQETFDVLEAHVLEAAAAVLRGAQAEVDRLDEGALCHQDGALDGV